MRELLSGFLTGSSRVDIIEYRTGRNVEAYRGAINRLRHTDVRQLRPHGHNQGGNRHVRITIPCSIFVRRQQQPRMIRTRQWKSRIFDRQSNCRTLVANDADVYPFPVCRSLSDIGSAALRNSVLF